MKKFKKFVSIIICAMMVTTLFTGGVSATEASTESTTAVGEATANEVVSDAAAINTDESWKTGIIHITAGEEIPDDWYLVPKEKMVIEGDYSLENLRIQNRDNYINFEPLYAYIAISIKHDYLDKYGIDASDFDLSSYTNDADIQCMYGDMTGAIKIVDCFSYDLQTTDIYLFKEQYSQDIELAECIVRAAYIYIKAAGYEDVFLASGEDFRMLTEFSVDKITFSDEQLHYFDD